jgi:acetyltransferase-like isoleucine patch superfamily enzyme
MSKLYIEVNTTSFGVNDNNATIVEWVFNESDSVHKGDVIVTLETTKSAFDVETPVDGFLIPLYSEGDEIGSGKPIFLIVKDIGKINQAKKEFKDMYSHEKSNTDHRITKKAKLKAQEHNILLEDLFDIFEGIIREKDVDNFLLQSDKDDPLIDEKEGVGLMDSKFLEKLTSDKLFVTLSSDEKIAIYRENGAVIEQGVFIGNRSIIISDYIHLMRNSQIGSDCYIRAKNFSLGIMSSVGNKSNIVANKIKIGDVCTLGHNIMVTGGFSKNAILVIGDNSLISSHCLLDAGEGIYIGNEVGISPHVKLYTHNHWQSELEGYHSNFGPITIKNKVYITGDCLIVPGVTIEDGATILANSTVISDVQSRSQMSGNPARIVGRIQSELTFEKKERIVIRLIKDMKRHCKSEWSINQDNIIYMHKFSQGYKTKGKLIITLNTPDKVNEKDLNCILFDLKSLTVHGVQDEVSDKVRNFLRRRGIRLKPIYWRYTKEKSLYKD